MYVALRSEEGYEIVRISSVDSATALTVVRAQDGTTAVSHFAGESLRVVPTANAFNRLREEVQAVQTQLGITGSQNFLRRDGTNTMTGNLSADATSRTIGTSSANWGDLYLNKTAGSVLFMGASGQVSEDNAGFFFDAAEDQLGVGGTPDQSGYGSSSAGMTVKGGAGGGGAQVFFELQSDRSVGNGNAVATVRARAGANTTASRRPIAEMLFNMELSAGTDAGGRIGFYTRPNNGSDQYPEALRIDSNGTLLVGHVQSGGTNRGDVVLRGGASNGWLRSQNAADSTTIGLIHLDGSDRIVINDTASVVGIVGDVVLGTVLTPNFDVEVDGNVRIRSNYSLYFGGTSAGDTRFRALYDSAPDAIRFLTQKPLQIESDATVTDGALIDSPILRLRAFYDSDPTAGIANATRDAEIVHNITAGGASPASQIDVSIAGSIILSIAPTLMGLVDALNVSVGTTTGTKWGTATSQKQAFYNATPIVQPSGTGETVGFTAGAGTNVTDQSTFTGNVGATAYRISDVVKALKNLGLLAA